MSRPIFTPKRHNNSPILEAITMKNQELIWANDMQCPFKNNIFNQSSKREFSRVSGKIDKKILFNQDIFIGTKRNIISSNRKIISSMGKNSAHPNQNKKNLPALNNSRKISVPISTVTEGFRNNKQQQETRPETSKGKRFRSFTADGIRRRNSNCEDINPEKIRNARKISTSYKKPTITSQQIDQEFLSLFAR